VITPPSFSNISDDDDDDGDESSLLAKFHKVMCSLCGEARVQLDYLMDTTISRNESIDDLNSHTKDGKSRFNLLKQELIEEKNTSFLLKQ
jgi:hypothetical protein